MARSSETQTTVILGGIRASRNRMSEARAPAHTRVVLT
jgi:hypothetical protein